MKNIISICIAILAPIYAMAQKIKVKEVPEVIQTEFNKRFPEATEIKWEKEKELYEVEFKLNQVEQSALFDASGNIKEIEIEISVNTLPSSVQEYVQKNYAGRKIKEAAKITDSNGTISYEAEIKGMDLIFDASGIFIREIKD